MNQNPTIASSPDSTLPQTAAATPQNEPIKPDGLRDTIDSIVIAFILAFVFRAFIVEAFVIPTGSMAPSLYGMHGQHRCANCGYSFAYGIREPMLTPNNKTHPGTLHDGNGALSSFPVRCPNCTWDGTGNSNLNSGDNPVTPDSGDRILVLKWPYDLGGSLLGPKRWDVVVFKNPQDGEINFIKRLLGLPGEVLQIINGDVYTAPIKSVPQDIIKSLRDEPPRNQSRNRLTDDQLKRLAKLMKIQRKTEVAQSSLWMLHYDHDYVPIRRMKETVRSETVVPYWQERASGPVPSWDTTTPAVRFKPTDSDRHWIDLLGHQIEDEYGYNNTNYSNGGQMSPRAVGDVLLKFVIIPGDGNGDITLHLRKGPDQFQVQLSVQGEVKLEKYNNSVRGGYWQEIRRSAMPALVAEQAVEIEFENLDYRIALRVNGEEIIATDDTQYPPPLEQLLAQPYEDGRNAQASVAIAARELPLEIRHLQVLRDVFYRSDLITDSIVFNKTPGWGTAMNPILLRESPQEFFCCGDNSPQSKDSRLWTDVCLLLQQRKPPNEYQYGTVPGDQLIGRAFFVYWPSGLRFSKDTMAVVPNVGRMRLIR